MGDALSAVVPAPGVECPGVQTPAPSLTSCIPLCIMVVVIISNYSVGGLHEMIMYKCLAWCLPHNPNPFVSGG